MTERINFSIESEGSSENARAAAQTVIDALRAAGMTVETWGVNRRPIGRFRAIGEIYVPAALPHIKFVIEGQVVQVSRARTQRVVARILDKLAAAHPGHEVRAVYPEDADYARYA